MAKYIDLNNCVKDKDTGKRIPKNDKNIDYREYLKWLAKGNKPDVESKKEKKEKEELKKREILIAEKVRQMAIDTLIAEGVIKK